MIGRTLRSENIPNILLGPEDAQLPTDIGAVMRLLDTVESQRCAFNQIVEAIMGEKRYLEWENRR